METCSQVFPCGIPGARTIRLHISNPLMAVSRLPPRLHLDRSAESLHDTLRLGAPSLQSTDITPSAVTAFVSSWYSHELSAIPTREFSQSKSTLWPCIALAPITAPLVSVK